jgi:hypothetical protein
MIDHSALKSALQIKITGRRFARFNERAMFLTTFLSRMTIIHRSGKDHLNADGLSRLACIDDDENKEEIQEEESMISLLIVTDSTHSGFLDSVRDAILKDDVFGKIFEEIRDQIQKLPVHGSQTDFKGSMSLKLITIASVSSNYISSSCYGNI